MLQEIFYDSLKISKFQRVYHSMENHSNVTGWQELLFPSNFRRPLRSLLILIIMLFQFLLTIFEKANCLLAYSKLIA